MTASRSLRDIRFASRPLMGTNSRRSAVTSAAMSVGNVSPGKCESLRIPARDSRIDCHTSALLRPIEQMMPAPVMAIRIELSGLRIGSSEVKPGPAAFYSTDGGRSAEAEDAAELRLQLHDELHDLSRLEHADHFAAIDARQKSMTARLPKGEPAAELRHRLHEHHLARKRIVRGDQIPALDRLAGHHACRARRANWA